MEIDDEEDAVMPSDYDPSDDSDDEYKPESRNTFKFCKSSSVPNPPIKLGKEISKIKCEPVFNDSLKCPMPSCGERLELGQFGNAKFHITMHYYDHPNLIFNKIVKPRNKRGKKFDPTLKEYVCSYPNCLENGKRKMLHKELCLHMSTTHEYLKKLMEKDTNPAVEKACNLLYPSEELKKRINIKKEKIKTELPIVEYDFVKSAENEIVRYQTKTPANSSKTKETKYSSSINESKEKANLREASTVATRRSQPEVNPTALPGRRTRQTVRRQSGGAELDNLVDIEDAVQPRLPLGFNPSDDSDADLDYIPSQKRTRIRRKYDLDRTTETKSKTSEKQNAQTQEIPIAEQNEKDTLEVRARPPSHGEKDASNTQRKRKHQKDTATEETIKHKQKKSKQPGASINAHTCLICFGKRNDGKNLKLSNVENLKFHYSLCILEDFGFENLIEHFQGDNIEKVDEFAEKFRYRCPIKCCPKRRKGVGFREYVLHCGKKHHMVEKWMETQKVSDFKAVYEVLKSAREESEEDEEILDKMPPALYEEIQTCILCDGKGADQEGKNLSLSEEKISETRYHYASCFYDKSLAENGLYLTMYKPTLEEGEPLDELGAVMTYTCFEKGCAQAWRKNQSMGYKAYAIHMSNDHGGLEEVMKAEATKDNRFEILLKRLVKK